MNTQEGISQEKISSGAEKRVSENHEEICEEFHL